MAFCFSCSFFFFFFSTASYAFLCGSKNQCTCLPSALGYDATCNLKRFSLWPRFTPAFKKHTDLAIYFNSSMDENWAALLRTPSKLRMLLGFHSIKLIGELSCSLQIDFAVCLEPTAAGIIMTTEELTSSAETSSAETSSVSTPTRATRTIPRPPSHTRGTTPPAALHRHNSSLRILTMVRALYDFESGGGSELGFTADEILTIINQDVGDGWVEAKNSRGQTGLIPEAYTEVFLPEPKMPPPPPPSNFMMGGQGPPTPQSPQIPPPQFPPPPPQKDSGWSAPPATAPPPVNNGYSSNQNHARQESYDEWDDDWDDDDSSTTTETQDVTGSQYLSQGGLSKKDAGKGTVSKKFGNRFSAFSKSGGDAYLFGTVNVPMPESEKLQITDSPDGPMWNPTQLFTCALASPKKESKFHGMKSFIAYQVTPSFSNIQVSRRYKHFDWLHDRLAEKYTTIIVPPLPDKQISGRYEEDFITERMRQLQLWIDRMCQHPVISHSDVFHHFMSCTDDKRWKQGKRRAEKDEFQGGKFFLSITTPDTPLDQKDVEQKVERFSRYIKSMDDSVRHLCNIGDNNVKKHNGPFRKEFQKLGNSFVSLARSFEFDERPAAQNLTRAIESTGKTYNEVGQLFAEQPRADMIPLIQRLEEYKGLLAVFPDALSVHRGASQKIEESYNKLKEEELQVATGRIDMISYALLAEMGHFNEHRVPDFKALMQNYLKGQIGFYQRITHLLEDALQKYDDA